LDNTIKVTAGRQSGLPGPFKKWIALILCLLALYLFAFVFLPFLSNSLPGFRQAHDIIIEEKIDAGAWFYIFVEQIGEIEPVMRDTMKYPPGHMDTKK
jgi:hypothetical protein